MMETYPSFDSAVERFKAFLADNEQPTEIQWVFRDHVYSDRNTSYVKTPLPESNTEVAAHAYSAGTFNDQVAIKALAKFPNCIVATIWYPLTEQHRPQGWEQGLRYSIVEPLQTAAIVSRGWRWQTLKLTATYRRYHKYTGDIILSTNEIESTGGVQHTA